MASENKKIPSKTQAEIDAEFAYRKKIDEEAERAAIETVRRQHEEQEKLRPLPPITGATPAVDARPGEEMVVMLFPRPMYIWAMPVQGSDDPRLMNRYKVTFGAGLQNVPVSLSTDPYLAAAGVKLASETAK